MSRGLLIAVVWAFGFALTACLAWLAGPEPARRALGAAAPAIAAHFGTDAVRVAPPAPAPVQAEPTPSVPRAPVSKPPLDSQPTPESKAPRRQLPAREGATESGIPGLGSLPAGPGAAYQGLGVQVFSRQTGQPVTGARVRFALQAQLDEWQRANPDTPLDLADPEEVLQVCTQPVQTKFGGVALADSAPGRMLVDANVGRQYGFAWVDRDKDARARIDLVEDRMVVAHVTDERGAPRPNTAVLLRDSSCAELWRGVTNAAGIAYWKHAAFLIERDATPGECSLTLEALEARPRVELIRRPHLDVREMAFQVKPSGILCVNVVDAAGAKVREPLVLTCSTGLDAACRSAVRRTLVDGTATFDLVEPGLALQLEIDGKNSFESSVTTVSAPAAAGETRTVTVTCGRRLPIVRARIVGDAAKPLAKLKVMAWLEFQRDGRDHSLGANSLVESDDTGAVRFVLSHPPDGASSTRLLIVAQNEYGDWCNAGRFALDLSAGTVDHDLGERHLVEMPTLAAGYVLSDKGWPVPGAIVEVSAGDGADADPETFTADLRFSAIADSMGRFRLRGLVEGARIALTASAPEHARPPRRVVERGERKIALELPRSASMRGTILFPPGVTFEVAHVWVDVGTESIPAAVEPGGAWRCSGLPPGNAGLRLSIDGLEEPVYSVPSITLSPGVEWNDPLSATIDLRTRLTRIVLRILDQSAAPIPKGRAVVTERREEGPVSREIEFQRGVLEVFALRPAVDIEILAPGFQSLSLKSVDRSTDARLTAIREN